LNGLVRGWNMFVQILERHSPPPTDFNVGNWLDSGLGTQPLGAEVNVSIERHPPFDALRHPVDARLAMLITLARGLTQSEIDPLQVRFSYPRPGETKEHERCFRAPLRFDAQVAGISFRTSDLERPVVSADEVLDGYLDRYAEDLLAKLASGDTVAKVVLRTLWGQLSGGQVDLATTSRHLGMSSRTLQRRLRDEDTSFAELLDLFRREASQRLLKDRGLAVEEVAFMLGYSEPSTFYRAFRRWTGLTPRRFRHSA
jgi:AraC-like DNA-binding protein